MRIGGFQQFSLSDFPGRTAAIVFTQGCNFRCPFCHNGSLIPQTGKPGDFIPETRVLKFMRLRCGILDGLVVTGGEPTLQPDLPAFLRRIKAMGFEVKLDTNGSRPEVLGDLLLENLVDYIAMDIKGPSAIYDTLTGVRTPIRKLEESIELISKSGIHHEFRTTLVEPLISEADIPLIKEMVPHGSTHRLQMFNPETVFDPSFLDTVRSTANVS